jgi:hypothetical protein
MLVRVGGQRILIVYARNLGYDLFEFSSKPV